MGRGEHVAPTPNLTFGEAYEKFMQSASSSLRPATLAAYQSSGEVHLLPEWRRRRLDRISVDAVASLIERMGTAEYRREAEARTAAAHVAHAEAQGKRPRKRPRDLDKITTGYKAWTVRGVLTVAGRVFDHAHRRLGWAGENPVRQLERSERPRSDQRERRVLTSDELRWLLAATDDRYRLIFALAAGTGARLGEVLGLKWRSVDLKAGTVSFTHQLDRRRQYVELKTKRSRRTVELPADLAKALKERQLAAPRGTGPDDYLFATRAGGPLEHRSVGGRALGAAVKRAKLKDVAGQPAPTFHSLRHTFASAWIASGGDLVELSAHLGHRDPAVTASVYSHEFEKAARRDARRTRLDQMFTTEAGSAYGSLVESTDRSVVKLVHSAG